MSARVLISILSMNRAEGARQCVMRALSVADRNAHFVLTDNASADGTGAFFDECRRSFPDRFTVFHEAQNTGFQYGHNRAFRIAAREGFDIFFCLNDDVILSDKSMASLLTPFDNDPCLALCGDKHGCSELSTDFHGKPGKLEYVEASSMMVNVPLVSRLRRNLFSDALIFAYGEDSDLSLFVREKGLGIATVDAGVQHFRSQTSNSTPELRAKCRESQEHNHAVNRKRWAHYMKARRMDYPIVIRRMGALGDVILTTPLVRAIRRDFPMSEIFVETGFPEVFENSPHITRADRSIPRTPDMLEINLDMAYENMPMTHIVHAYEKVARTSLPGLGTVELRTELFPPPYGEPSPRIALVHTDKIHWPGKHIPSRTLDAVMQHLEDEDWNVMRIGKSERPTTLAQLAGMSAIASLFIGPDSAPFHVAQAMGCPSVVAYGCTRARFIATQGSPHMPVESSMSIEGSGERHRSRGQVASSASSACMESITPAQIIKAIQKLAA